MPWTIDYYSEDVRLPRGREGIARVFYCTKVGKKIIILHSFIKKTNDTPKRELDIARRRQREVIET